MRQILKRHPDTPCEAVAAITVEVERPAPGLLTLRYLVVAAAPGLLTPPPAEPARTDELWRHTCFEAFLRGPDGDGYAELNLAPSGQWAAYEFDGYRQGMRPAEPPVAPAIGWRAARGGHQLTAVADLSGVAGLSPEGAWRLGLCAVIEETGGRTSYWALAHPPGKADFHRQEGFALDLAGLPSQEQGA